MAQYQSIPRFAVISAHNRHDMLLDTITYLAPQCDRIIVVDNASDPPIQVSRTAHRNAVIIIRDEQQPPNLSHLWNRGIDLAYQAAMHLHVTQWDTAVFGDDVYVPPYWWNMVSHAMRGYNCMAGATHGVNPLDTPIIKRERDHNIFQRMPGWAFMLRGERTGPSELRLDESFGWWWGDTDLDWRAREMGGMILSTGPIAINREPNRWTVEKPELTRQAGQDRMTFLTKWGVIPW